MKLNVVGSVFSQTGYAVHTRFLAEALQTAGHDVAVESQKLPGWENLCPDKLFKMLQKQHQREVSIMISTPDFYEHKWADNPEKLIGFCVWEGDVIPKYWLKHFEVCDQIWVPSLHVQEAILSTLNCDDTDPVLPPIHIVPHGVDHSLFSPKKVERDDRFTFLSIKGWADGLQDRGGMQYLIKAFVEEFSEDEPVKLLVKINGAYGGSEAHISAWLAEMDIKKLPNNVELILDDIPYRELIDVYNKGDVFVCPTRGEAFNLVGLEAMACGLPTLQTGFGGQLDYMTDKNSLKIIYELEEPTHNPMLEGMKWATPSIEHLKNQMRWCFEEQEKVKQMGVQALKDSLNWSWLNSALLAEKAIDKL